MRRGNHFLITFITLLLVVFFLSGCSFLEFLPETDKSINPSVSDSETFTVKNIVDGDTIILSNGNKVRYIGINTPERGQLFYEEAAEYHKELVSGQKVRLEYDVVKTDQFDRILAYVFVGDLMINLEMIKAGWALFYSDPDNDKYDDKLQQALRQAQKNQKGMWKASSVSIVIQEVEYDPPGEDAKNLNGEWVELINTGAKFISMKGFILKDEAKNQYVFSDFTFQPSASVRIFTGSGRDDKDSLYWGSKDPIWNNDGDTAYLYDQSVQLICSKNW